MTRDYWSRKGYASRQEYSAACAQTREIKDAVLEASGARLAHNLVLRHMMKKGENDRPTVKITRKQIAVSLGIDFKTVRAAYKVLKKEGSIEAIYNTYGGAGNATTYLFKPPEYPAKTKEEGERIEHERVTKEKADEIMKEFKKKK